MFAEISNYTSWWMGFASAGGLTIMAVTIYLYFKYVRKSGEG